VKVPSPLVGEGKHSSPRYRSEMGEGSLGLRYLSAYALARTMTVINFDTNATPEAAISLFRVAIEMPVDKAQCASRTPSAVITSTDHRSASRVRRRNP